LAQTGLATLAGSRWVGAGELWLDPLGDEAREYDCTNDQRRIGALYLVARRHAARRRLHPSRRTGKLVRQLASADRRRVLRATRGARIARAPPCLPGIRRPGLALAHDLVREPSGELVLQMTNVAPWGEEQRAVRMVFTRKS